MTYLHIYIYTDILIYIHTYVQTYLYISQSQKGLQKCIDNLNEYCCKWGLEVNIDKAKVIVFSKRSHKAI